MAMLVLDQTASSDITETLLQRKGMVRGLHAILSLLESYLTLPPGLERREKTKGCRVFVAYKRFLPLYIEIIIPFSLSFGLKR